MECFSAAAGRWTPSAPMPDTRTGAAAAVTAKKLYVCGGNQGNFSLRTVISFDPQAAAWEVVVPMLTERHVAMAAGSKDWLCVFGGYSGGQFLSSGERFDTNMNS